MFAVAPETVGECERPRLGRRLCSCIDRVRMGRRLRLAGRDEHEPASSALEQMRRECLRRMLDGAHEQTAQEVPVLERRVLDRGASTPPSDEVDEPVDVPVLLGKPSGPVARRLWIQEIDDGRLDHVADVFAQRFERA